VLSTQTEREKIFAAAFVLNRMMVISRFLLRWHFIHESSKVPVVGCGDSALVDLRGGFDANL